MSRLEEKTIQSHTIFEGRVIRVELDEVRLPNGETSTRELVQASRGGLGAGCHGGGEDRLGAAVPETLGKGDSRITRRQAGAGERIPQTALCGSWRKRLDTGRTALTTLVSFYTSPGLCGRAVAPV